MDGISEAELERVAEGIGRDARLLAARLADGPAARLGRLGAPDDGTPAADGGFANAGFGGGAFGSGAFRLPMQRAGAPDERPLVSALRELGTAAVERVLGALELAVPELDGPDLSAYVPRPAEVHYFTIHLDGQESEAVTAAGTAARLHDGLEELVLSLTRRLAGHPKVVLPPAPGDADERTILARHGAGHLALAVSVANALLNDPERRYAFPREAAVVGLGLGAAVLLLCETPMPDAYRAARLARIRAEYLLPRRAHGQVLVAGHRFALLEGDRLPDGSDFTATGLVSAVEGGALVRTGTASGAVRVDLDVLEAAPEHIEPDWDEIAEVSWHATAGLASVIGAGGRRSPGLTRATPPWPGDYRLRVHARGRDPEDDGGHESYLLTVWAAPPAPPLVLRSTDRLGHRLRGEPEPVVPPAWAYRWIGSSDLGEAATVTVVVGMTAAEALRAFGADPDDPCELPDSPVADSLVALLSTPEAVLLVEENGYHGSRAEVLTALSVNGLAASMFWNVNRLTQLAFAEDGRLIAAFEPYAGYRGPAELADVLDGLSFDDGDLIEQGLVAVERFTGRGLTRADLAAMADAGVAFPVRGTDSGHGGADRHGPRLSPARRLADRPGPASLRGLGRRLATLRIDEESGTFRFEEPR